MSILTCSSILNHFPDSLVVSKVISQVMRVADEDLEYISKKLLTRFLGDFSTINYKLLLLFCLKRFIQKLRHESTPEEM